jgi:GT2 family glycosyltransferase
VSANSPCQLAVILVNYQTRDDLRNCLASIFASAQRTPYEVWVVDNASPDGSAAMVARYYPQVRLIALDRNVGFARANNEAIRRSRTEFVLLLNPDTIVSDHAFDDAIDFLRATPSAGMVTCKLVKADGTLDLACRRSFPSAFDGFCRAVGLSKLFPRSRRFARYNLTFLDENETQEVDAVNGAYMMVKRKIIDEVGLLDERYFMYMEDLDWCFRFRQKGWRIYYHPSRTVIHLKGQSGKKHSTKMIRAFFESMEMFCRHNYMPRQSKIISAATVLGIRTWRELTLFRNAVRREKRVTP